MIANPVEEQRKQATRLQVIVEAQLVDATMTRYDGQNVRVVLKCRRNLITAPVQVRFGPENGVASEIDVLLPSGVDQ